MQWHTDGIEPTYSIGDTRAWLLDGRIELETDEPAPIRAWAEFVPPKTRSSRKMLATFHLGMAGGPGLCVRAWRLPDAVPGKRVTAEDMDPSGVRRYIPSTELTAPVLQTLIEERRAADAERERQYEEERAADPLIDKLEDLKLCHSDFAHLGEERVKAELHATIDALPRAEVDEILTSLVIEYEEQGDKLYDYEHPDELPQDR